mmetsp:Transcript_5937/g.12954  ORF Transcript_5937/g.12954 Transcript_5937/m.12954 type:complete len:225 (-) Transcript_5937:1504-2178(-)
MRHLQRYSFPSPAARPRWRSLRRKEPGERADIGGDAIISLVAKVEGRCRGRVVGLGIERGVCPLGGMLYEDGKVHGLGPDALVEADIAPEALVHQENARHRDGLLHAQRLDGGAKPSVHDEGVHLAEEQPEVRALCLEELPLARQLACQALHLSGHPVRLPLAHVEQCEVMPALAQHLDRCRECLGPAHRHRREGHHHQLPLPPPGLRDEGGDGPVQRAASGGA